MEYPIAELCDRYSIASLKSARIGSDECTQEKETLTRELIQVMGKYDLRKEIQELININAEIWDLEAAIRQGKDEELGLEEIGRRAIAIRGKNKIRIEIKNRITEKTGNGFKDIKKNHISV
jgi:hypothetical protein